MTVKSVVDIEINDQQFAAFSEKFTKYSEMLAKAPGAWAGVNKEMKTSFESVAAALLAHKELTDEAEKSQQNLEDSSHRVSKFWSDTAKSAKSVAGSIKDGAASLLKWTAAGTIFSGLLGVGSLFGLDALAGGVGNTRRTSLGLGTTYGEQKAFGLNFGRVVDSDAVLGGVNTALHDAQQRSALYGAGLTQSDIVGKDTAQVSVALLSKIKTLVDQTDPALLGQLQSSRKLDTLGFSLETLERLRATPRSELNEYIRSNERDSKALGLDPKGQKIWQSFQVQLDRAGQKIENVFVRGLEPLVGPLDKLSDSVAKAITTLLSSPKIGEWVTEFGKGIEATAKYIGSEKFQKDIQTFATDVGLVAEALVGALKWLGVVPRSKEEQAARRNSPNIFDKVLGTVVGSAVFADKALLSLVHGNNTISAAEKSHNLPSGLLQNTYGAESRYGTRLRSPAGAQGPFQFMPDTARRFGLKDSFDLKSSADAAGKYYDVLLKEFHGDYRKAVAAYNWGEGHVEADVRRHGKDWEDHIPRETKDYLTKVLSGRGLAKGVTVQINDNTGGNVHILTSQLPQ